jgi:hypothetical protein
MPTEHRFDDLDLREEPARDDAEQSDHLSDNSNRCGTTPQCTGLCCPPVG